jgi:3-hydroxybutyryl-CoA dehydrogenase
VGHEGAVAALQAPLIFEGVPERMEAKRDCLAFIGRHAPADAIVASTTSTFLVTELAGLIDGPERFLNAHWLNPAHLMPLVEISRSALTSDDVVTRLENTLRAMGKVPVVCGPAPGYIVPRIQALAMNEAARIVEEGIATAEAVDLAVRTGFGLRFAVLGLLEFIDWGGGDILYYASRYLSSELGERYRAPEIVERNMHEKRNGLRDGNGFYDWRNTDVAAYREKRLGDFSRMLTHAGLLPQPGAARALD